jgi:hypothetical protein
VLLASLLLFALTRAEIIDRFNAAPVTRLSGLVQVHGNCPADMRREFQLPIASFATGVCRKLYEVEKMQPVKFAEPGIIIRIGDVREKLTNVVVSVNRREGGGGFTRIRIPSPSGADLDLFRTEIVKAFHWAVKNERIDAEEALRRMRLADPQTKAAGIAADIASWREGRYREGMDDEAYLKMLRTVHTPGTASRQDVLTFASRLFLYPADYAHPFCGLYTSLPFREAALMAAKDPAIRFAAYMKTGEIALYGGGRGLKMDSASLAYQNFLRELARYKLPQEELLKLLDDAESKLKGVIDEN